METLTKLDEARASLKYLPDKILLEGRSRAMEEKELMEIEAREREQAKRRTKFTLQYTAIQVTDLDRALGFYLDILGMRLVTRVKVPETKGEFAIVKSEGAEHWLEINWYADQEYPSGNELDHIAFQVEDLDEALSELKQKGIKPISCVRESKNSRWTYVADPDGIWIEIFQKKD